MSSLLPPLSFRCRRALLVMAATAMACTPLHLSAAPRWPEPNAEAEAEGLSPDYDIFITPEQRVLPLNEAARLATTRFRGRLIAARLRPPTPGERDRGVELVHELRLLTPDRDVILIRLDAHDGSFLEVRGAGLTRARRSSGEK
ncbi:hypothetical protein [Paracoccus ravus]|uniref:hypothetical protein n=1 Tax=Paracoccus ravus TaxID=2447760 RepID=UPI00106DE97F|nr:hypothetical protein [Paracoccus ravus]